MQNGVGAQRPQIVTGAAQAPLTKNRRGGLDRWANAFSTVWATAGSAIWDACWGGEYLPVSARVAGASGDSEARRAC